MGPRLPICLHNCLCCGPTLHRHAPLSNLAQRHHHRRVLSLHHRVHLFHAAHLPFPLRSVPAPVHREQWSYSKKKQRASSGDLVKMTKGKPCAPHCSDAFRSFHPSLPGRWRHALCRCFGRPPLFQCYRLALLRSGAVSSGIGTRRSRLGHVKFNRYLCSGLQDRRDRRPPPPTLTVLRVRVG